MSALTRLPFDLPGAVYRSPMPLGPYDPDQELLKDYHAANIDLVVMLSATGEDVRLTGLDLACLYQRAGFKILQLPIPDFSTPPREALAGVLEKIRAAALQGQNVVIHCSAGIGRTGLVSACLARQTLGLDGEAAIAWVRDIIPGAIETETQRQFVLAF
ncbi:MAG TPA: dual specificity protein phosphatase family protein [Anaerolineales bacterium]|nr:dual specificity protein phosphatase family protein [Anaerolineales bacterium]